MTQRSSGPGSTPEAADNEVRVPGNAGSATPFSAAALPSDDLSAIDRSVLLMETLRSPQGCPWDREQTFDSIQRYSLEELYEVFDAIDRRAWPDLRDELGDLLLQVLFYAQMAKEAGYFTFKDVAEALNQKLIRRHPHVFGDITASDTEAVMKNWETIKLAERQAREQPVGASLLDQVPRLMPGLLEAQKLGGKAAKVGFDWPHVDGLFAKLSEETDEVQAEANNVVIDQQRVSEEIGDLLFTAVNLARHLDVDPEGALRAANAKFRRRFAAMEASAEGKLEELTPAAWDELWRAAKSKGATAQL